MSIGSEDVLDKSGAIVVSSVSVTLALPTRNRIDGKNSTADWDMAGR
jgi:hypothetical protein